MNLKKRIEACQNCPLSQQNNTFLPLFGIGSVNPKYFVIIDGIDEDNAVLGKPIGNEEELVLLESINLSGLSKQDFYITSIIKCGTAAKNNKYVKVCFDWIKEEIAVLQPKKIIVIGKKTNELCLKFGLNNISYFDTTLFQLFRCGRNKRDTFVKFLKDTSFGL